MDALISDLLYEYNCVIIPDFGGIVANKKEAELLKFSQKIVPPRKRLAFNRSLTSNDGLLIDYVARKRSCSYADAELAVKAYVADLTNSIAELKEARIEGVGTFRRDFLDNIHFYPDMDSNFELAAFGLTTMPIKPIERIVPAKQEALNELSKPAVVANVSEPIRLSESRDSRKANTIRREPSENSKILLRIAAIFAGIFMITSFLLNLQQEVVSVDNSAIVTLNKHIEEKVGENIRTSQVDEFVDYIGAKELNIYEAKIVEEVESFDEELAFADNEDIETNVVEEDIEELNNVEEIAIKTETENELAVVDMETSEVATISPVPNDVHLQPASANLGNREFLIIVGSFKTKGNAVGLLHDLKNKGYQTDTLHGPNGYTRVGVKFNADFTDVSTALKNVRGNVVKDAWLLE